MSASACLARQRGAGLIETMVGILIGLIVIIVIYNLLAVSENYKRTAIGASDAQITGLMSQFVAGREAGNGGNGISLASPDLINCDPAKAAGAWPYVGLWRPIPVLIRDSGSADISDSFVTLYSGSPHVVWSVAFTSDVAVAGPPMTVQSPNGFTSPTPAVRNYRVVAINAATGDCEDAIITAATAADALGRVTLTQGAPKTAAAYGAINSRLLNLGPVGLATRTIYEARTPGGAGACDNTASPAPAAPPPCQLFSMDLLTAGATWNPIAQNIVLVKAQYGVDQSATPDGTADCWTPAIDGGPCGVNNPNTWSDGSMRNLSAPNLQRVVAVRIGIVVRDDEPDIKEAATNLKYSNRPAASKYLFNCAADDDVICGRVLLSNAVMRDGWRYRTYETVIPLRNAIFNDLP